MKKFAGDTIILHMCTKNHRHMMYGSWDTKFFVILGHFLPFYLSPIMIPNIESSKKKWKKCLEIIILLYLHVYLKWRSYDVWFLRYRACDRQNFLLFWTVFCPFTPLTTQKIKLLKKWKAWRYYHFTHK